MVARADGVRASLNVAPSTRTHSVVKNKAKGPQEKPSMMPSAVSAVAKLSPVKVDAASPLDPEAKLPTGMMDLIDEWIANAVPNEAERELYATGRPIVLDETRCKTILAMVAMGVDKVIACRAAGISKNEFYSWAKRFRMGDPAAARLAWFFRSLDQAEAICESLLIAGVVQGGWNWQSRCWMLERKFHERWRQKSLDDGGAGAAKVEPHRPLEEMSDEEIEAYEKKILEHEKQTRAPRRSHSAKQG